MAVVASAIKITTSQYSQGWEDHNAASIALAENCKAKTCAYHYSPALAYKRLIEHRNKTASKLVDLDVH